MSWKSWSLNLLGPSGPHQAFYGTPLPLPLHVTWLPNSTFLVCRYLDAFTDIIIHFMNVRRNWKVFSFCVKQAAINFFTRTCARTCACAYACTCTLMHMSPCVFIHAWLASLYMYAAFAHQLILRPPIFHFIYVNTSVDYECFCTFFNVSVLEVMYIHSACRFKKLCLWHFSF